MDYVKAYSDHGSVYHGEARRLAAQLLTGTLVIRGVIRWTSNDRVPPPECVDLADHIGIMVHKPACDVARDEDARAALEAYRANPPTLLPEDFAEMRNAFGAGATVTNVITGQKWEL